MAACQSSRAPAPDEGDSVRVVNLVHGAEIANVSIARLDKASEVEFDLTTSDEKLTAIDVEVTIWSWHSAISTAFYHVSSGYAIPHRTRVPHALKEPLKRGSTLRVRVKVNHPHSPEFRFGITSKSDVEVVLVGVTRLMQ